MHHQTAESSNSVGEQSSDLIGKWLLSFLASFHCRRYVPPLPLQYSALKRVRVCGGGIGRFGNRQTSFLMFLDTSVDNSFD